MKKLLLAFSSVAFSSIALATTTAVTITAAVTDSPNGQAVFLHECKTFDATHCDTSNNSLREYSTNNEDIGDKIEKLCGSRVNSICTIKLIPKSNGANEDDGDIKKVISGKQVGKIPF